MTKGVIDDIADGRSIAGTGKAVRFAPIGERDGGWLVVDEYLLEDFGGGFDAGGGFHRDESLGRESKGCP